MRDFDIVIAHRGNPLGLWATIHSCEIELAKSDFDYKYLICANGEGEHHKQKLDGSVLTTSNHDLDRTMEFLEKSGKLGWYEKHDEALAPPTARQLATEHTDAKYLFFFDNHCLVTKDYFNRAMLDFKHYGMDMLHSTTKFFVGDITTYHYNLKLEKNFWAESSVFPQYEHKPYKIAAAGHGGFAVNADVWREVGGYWKGFHGYGGEEMYFDLKMAMLDKTNFIDPLMIHYHFAGNRGYPRHYSSDYYRNMMMCARIIGGEEWMYKVYSNFEDTGLVGKNSTPMHDLLTSAELETREHANWLQSVRKRTLDEQLQLFRQHEIQC